MAWMWARRRYRRDPVAGAFAAGVKQLPGKVIPVIPERSWSARIIILGFSAARTGERALGALYLGYRKDGALRYAGKVGTGFSMKSACELAERFAAPVVETPVLTRLVRFCPDRYLKSRYWEETHSPVCGKPAGRR
jgi:hypothetical protein